MATDPFLSMPKGGGFTSAEARLVERLRREMLEIAARNEPVVPALPR